MMTIYHKITYMTIVLAMLVACTKDEMTEGLEKGAFVTRPDFTDGGEPTRSTFIFDDDILKFSWGKGDQLGLYPTYQLARQADEENQILARDPGKTDPLSTQQGLFVCTEGGDNTVHIDPSGEQADNFSWADGYLRTAYYPYKASNDPNATTKVFYNAIPFDFSGQVQSGYVDMTAYYVGTGSKNTNETKPGYTNQEYRDSEAKACAHLGKYDYMVSPEVQNNSGHIRFPLHHIGAIARFFLLAPEEQMILRSLKLVASKPIFYTRCTVDLSSMRCNPGAANDGLHLLPASEYEGEPQIHPDESSKTAMLELKFPEGPENMVKTLKQSEKVYGNYLIAYLMMYPVNTADAKELYVYLDAETIGADGKPTGVIKHYRTDNINTTTKNMFSGKYYQWTYRTLDDDHPIELTATVIPWQDVVGGNISTGE